MSIRYNSHDLCSVDFIKIRLSKLRRSKLKSFSARKFATLAESREICSRYKFPAAWESVPSL